MLALISPLSEPWRMARLGPIEARAIDLCAAFPPTEPRPCRAASGEHAYRGRLRARPGLIGLQAARERFVARARRLGVGERERDRHAARDLDRARAARAQRREVRVGA